MPLVTCPDCGKEVSATAPACPECGRPTSKEAIARKVERVFGGLAGWFVFTIVSALIFLALKGCFSG